MAVLHNIRRANAFIGLTVAEGAMALAYGAWHSHTWHSYEALTLLVIATVTARMKVALPGRHGNMSVNLPFLLLAVSQLSPIEAMVVACVATVAQSIPRDINDFKPVRMLFNVSMMASASGLAGIACHLPAWSAKPTLMESAMLIPAAAVFFLGQTIPVATVITLTEGGSIGQTWLNIAQLTFPYFTLSACLTSVVIAISSHPGWGASVVVLAVMYGVYRSFTRYFKESASREHSGLAMTARAGN